MTDTGGRYLSRQRMMAYVLGNASGLGVAVAVLFAVSGAPYLAGIAGAMIVGSFFVFRTFPWRSLHTDR